MKYTALLVTLAAALVACSDDSKSDAEFKSEVVASMHTSIGEDLADLLQAAQDLQTQSPTAAWNASDTVTLDKMRDAWKRTRVAYEHVEGATAPIFPNLDVTMDARYDDYLVLTGPSGDANAFDGTGVTGMHGIERILYAHAPDIRTDVIAFESPLPGYRPAAFPQTVAEATDFKTKLVQKLIDDAKSLHDQWQPAAIDIGAAFQGLIGLMNEQKEKVNLAATGEEESRYANVTLFDLRNNLEGTRKVYEEFRPWIKSKAGGADSDAVIEARFDALATLYTSTSGEALPPVPGDWMADGPTPTNLATPFGVLWKTVRDDVDPAKTGSVVSEMNKIAVMLGFPEFVEE